LQIGLCELDGEVMEESDGNECVEQSKIGSIDRSYVDYSQTSSVWLQACSVMRKGRKIGLVVETSIKKSKFLIANECRQGAAARTHLAEIGLASFGITPEFRENVSEHDLGIHFCFFQVLIEVQDRSC
jgi:hypothetical protein